MEETLQLPLSYQGKEWLLPLSFVKWGYTYRIELTINETSVFFEPDEEGSYRAITETSQISNDQFDKGLLEAIVLKLSELKG